MTDIYFTVCYSITITCIILLLFLIAADTHRAHRRLNALHDSLNNHLLFHSGTDWYYFTPPPAAAA